MCGITGIRSFSIDPEAVRDSLACLVHRGPDDEGMWCGDGVALGQRRLSILDLSQASHQPMCTPDGRYVMVYNGEVYNYTDIRRELEARGRQFHTSGDCEVVLASLETWGVEAAVRRFIGMFAIALWDDAEKRLLLVRDRLGVKPLYYGWDGSSLWFGSELKALRAFKHWQPEIDRSALAEYFQFGYINAPRSIYRQVRKVPPGHWLELRNGQPPVVRQYWSVLEALGEPLTGSEDELAEQLEALMIDAFRLRMVSDVPVGMFLSGGIDSSLVTALLQKHHGNIHTFTIGFGEREFDEAPHARRVAAHLGTEHTEQALDVAEAKRILPRWADLYDEPFADSSGIPTYLVSKLASEQVKVVLSADGGDELFSGYSVYTTTLQANQRRERIPPAVRSLLALGLRPLPLTEFDAWAGSIRAVPERWRGRRRPTWRLCRFRDWVTSETPGQLYTTALGNSWWGHEASRLANDWNPTREGPDTYPGTIVDQMSLWDLHNYLPGDILAKVDRATMAASVEGREPLIDHRIVEFALRLPEHLRRGSLGPKHLLRKVLYKHVPVQMVERPKRGFAIPLSKWLNGDLGHLVDDHLDPARVRNDGILNPDDVKRTVRRYRMNDPQVTNRLWALVAFQMWRAKWL